MKKFASKMCQLKGELSLYVVKRENYYSRNVRLDCVHVRLHRLFMFGESERHVVIE